MEEYTKMISGEDYNPNDEYLVSLRQKAWNLSREFNNEPDFQAREKILKTLIAKVGDKCFITPNFNCDYGCNIELGDNVYLNMNCVILDSAPVKIGNNTLIGPSVQIYTPIHPLDYTTRNTFIETAKPVTIGQNCWIGGGVIILPGVKIGNGCVIGAGSVVTKDIPSGVVAVGNPCKVLRKITEADKNKY